MVENASRPRPPARSARQPSDSRKTCPAADMAVQAGHLIRLLSQKADASSITQALKSGEGPQLADIDRLLRSKLTAIEGMAPFVRATSIKGALFQIYLAESTACDLHGRVEDSRDGRASDYHEQICRLSRSAAAALEAEHDDDDLKAIRSWYVQYESEVDEVLAELRVA